MSSTRRLFQVAPIVVASLASAATPESEAEVKAEFVERFTRFIEWPAGAQPSDAAFVVCIWGESPTSAQLALVLAHRKIHGRAVQVKRVHEAEVLTGCQILYLAPTARDEVERVAGELRGKPVLSVGDARGFAELGLVINLFVDEASHVRFEINAEAARASGLQISAKLMTLGKLTSARSH
jgi:hypothetical protein